MKKDWNSHIKAKNPIDVTLAEAGVQCLLFKINRLVKSLDSGPRTRHFRGRLRRNDEQEASSDFRRAFAGSMLRLS